MMMFRKEVVMPILTCPNCGAKNRVDESKSASRQPVCGRCHTPLPVTPFASGVDGKPIEVTDATFPTLVLGASVPVLLDCWAPWCGPCRAIAPVMEQLAKESAGRYTVAKLNTDQNPRTASQFRIDAIPTMLLFKDGQLIDRLIGLQPKQAIAAKLASVA
jgi:thioredoxin